METDTEVQQTEAEIPAQQGEVTQAALPEATQEAPKENFVPQSRFDEQTRKFREAERRAQELESQNREIVAALLKRASEVTQPTQQAPEIDPEEAKKLSYFLSPLQQEVSRLKNEMIAATVGAKIQAAAPKGIPSEVLDDARLIAEAWAKNGQPVDASAAIKYAMGEYHYRKTAEGSEIANQRQELNRSATSTVQTSGGGGVARKPAGNQRALSDDEIESLSPEKQLEYWKSRVDPNEPF